MVKKSKALLFSLSQETILHYIARCGNIEVLKVVLDHIQENFDKVSSIFNKQAKVKYELTL